LQYNVAKVGGADMKKRKLTELLNARTENKLNMLAQVEKRNRAQSIRTRERSPEEKEILTRLMMERIERLEKQGRLKRDGRKWKLFIEKQAPSN
jgi:hypothetical protein